MKIPPLHSYPGQFVRLTLATTFEDLSGRSVLMPPGEIVDVLWVCNRTKRLLDVRIKGKLYVTSVTNLTVCGQVLPMSHLELCERGFLQPTAA